MLKNNRVTHLQYRILKYVYKKPRTMLEISKKFKSIGKPKSKEWERNVDGDFTSEFIDIERKEPFECSIFHPNKNCIIFVEQKRDRLIELLLSIFGGSLLTLLIQLATKLISKL